MNKLDEMRMRYCKKCDGAKLVALLHRFKGSGVSAGQWATVWVCLDCAYQHWCNDKPTFKDEVNIDGVKPNLEELEELRREVERLRFRVSQGDNYIERLLLGEVIE